MKQTILLFHFSKQDSLKLVKAFMPLRVRIKSVPEENYGETLGYLAGVKDCPANEDKKSVSLSDPMLVMCGFSGNQIDSVLSAIRRARVPAIPYKAILTPTNQNWDARELLEELKLEHEKMNHIDQK